MHVPAREFRPRGCGGLCRAGLKRLAGGRHPLTQHHRRGKGQGKHRRDCGPGLPHRHVRVRWQLGWRNARRARSLSAQESRRPLHQCGRGDPRSVQACGAALAQDACMSSGGFHKSDAAGWIYSHGRARVGCSRRSAVLAVVNDQIHQRGVDFRTQHTQLLDDTVEGGIEFRPSGGARGSLAHAHALFATMALFRGTTVARKASPDR